MKKGLISFGAALILVFGMSVTAFAASFSFSFTPPFAGSMQSTFLQEVTSINSAYVNPSHSATPTNYFLSPNQKSSTTATNILTDISTSGKRTFTYNSGYGGIGNKYCLSGYPSNWDFVDYTVSGSWSP